MVRIEPIDPRDLDVAMQIHAVQLLAHAQESALLDMLGVAAPDRPADDGHPHRQRHLGAFVGAELVGSVSVEPDDEPGQVGIVNLVVHPTHQRQGIGRLLVQEVLRRHPGGVVSVCAATRNAPALALYRQLGFVAYRRGVMGAQSLAIVKLRRADPRRPHEEAP